MLLLRTFAPWLLLAFLGQQVSPSSGARNKNRGADKSATAAPGRAQRGGDNKSAAAGRGRFSISDKIRCTWGARDAGAAVRLSVKCENREARVTGGVADTQCEYSAEPRRCSGYQTDPAGFWKQVGRAFKRLQGKVCKDERALVRAGMCKDAPRGAHFKLDPPSPASPARSGQPETPRPQPPRSVATAAPPAGPTACAVRANHRRRSEEHCGSWASVCAFFFNMLQSDDC